MLSVKVREASRYHFLSLCVTQLRIKPSLPALQANALTTRPSLDHYRGTASCIGSSSPIITSNFSLQNTQHKQKQAKCQLWTFLSIFFMNLLNFHIWKVSLIYHFLMSV